MDLDLLNEKIEQYLTNQLSEADAQAFEAEISNDPELEAEVKAHALAKAAIEAEGRNAIADMVKTAYAESVDFPKTKTFDLKLLAWPAAAAAVVAIIIGIGIWQSYQSQTTPTEIFAENYDAPALFASRDSGPDKEVAWEKVRKAYGEEDYPSTINLLTPLFQDSTFVADHNSESHLYYGIAQIELKHPDLALKSFEQINPASGTFYPEAQWYSAMAYLALDQPDKARQFLEPITSNPRHKYHAQATKILNELK